MADTHFPRSALYGLLLIMTVRCGRRKRPASISSIPSRRIAKPPGEFYQFGGNPDISS